jgi:argininosuccinate lyase
MRLKDANKLVRDYLASVPFDRRLYRQDIEGSIAHVEILRKQGIIAESEAKPKSRTGFFWRDEGGNR